MNARVIVSIAAFVALTACTSAEKAPSQVVSLQTGAITAGSNAAPPPSEEKRPRMRMDDTPEQARARMEPWEKCITENGGIPVGPGTPVPKREDWEHRKEAHAKAQATCRHLYPMEPWEWDKNNPESMDFIHRVAECMRRHGAKVKEVPAGPGEDYNRVYFDGPDPRFEKGKGMELHKKCEEESTRR